MRIELPADLAKYLAEAMIAVMPSDSDEHPLILSVNLARVGDRMRACATDRYIAAEVTFKPTLSGWGLSDEEANIPFTAWRWLTRTIDTFALTKHEREDATVYLSTSEDKATLKILNCGVVSTLVVDLVKGEHFQIAQRINEAEAAEPQQYSGNVATDRLKKLDTLYGYPGHVLHPPAIKLVSVGALNGVLFACSESETMRVRACISQSFRPAEQELVTAAAHPNDPDAIEWQHRYNTRIKELTNARL